MTTHADRPASQPPADALTAARELLAATADVDPATPAADLLRYLADYRTRLSALVTASAPR